MSTAEGETSQMLREKMIRILRIYPKLSPSMLHIGLGPSWPAKVWRPVLSGMIKDGTIIETSVADAGSRTYKVLSLSEQATQ